MCETAAALLRYGRGSSVAARAQRTVGAQQAEASSSRTIAVAASQMSGRAGRAQMLLAPSAAAATSRRHTHTSAAAIKSAAAVQSHTATQHTAADRLLTDYRAASSPHSK